MMFRSVPTFALAASMLVSPVMSQAPYGRRVAEYRSPVAELLVSHNLERRRAGVTPLAWDPTLAEGARAHANELARLQLLRHSVKGQRRGVGENLWMGTRGYYRPGAMVGSWVSERSMFRRARFPDVSTTGNWADVGHYTQMIWPSTQRVGCAIAASPSFEVLVCRYWPSGNVTGQPVP